MTTLATINKSSRIVTAPTTPIVASSQFLDHVRQDNPEDTELIDSYLNAASDWLGMFTRRSFITQTLAIDFDAWPTVDVNLELPPANDSPALVVTYLDPITALPTVLPDTEYEFAFINEPATLRFTGTDLPELHETRIGKITVAWNAGFGDQDSQPDQARQVVRMLAAHWYENRESVIVGTIAAPVPQAVEMLAWSLRVNWELSG